MGTINRNPLETALTDQFKDNFQITKETEEYFEVKIKSSGRIYTINKNGSIDKVKIGKKGESWADNGNGSYTKGDETVKIGDKKTSEDIKKALGIEDIKYTKDWEVIGVEDDKIKLISVNNVTYYTLGKNDPIVYKKDADGTVTKEVIDEIKDTDGDGVIGDLEKAAYSYAHVVDTLNKVTSEATGIEGARSITIEDIYGIIGENSVDKGSDYGTTYKYYCDDTTKEEEFPVYSSQKNSDGTWGTGSSIGNTDTYKKFTYVDGKKTVTIGKLADKSINKGSVELRNTSFSYKLNSLNSLNENQTKVMENLKSGQFWLASPCVYCISSRAYFNVLFINGEGITNVSLVYSNGNANNNISGVRAVVYI